MPIFYLKIYILFKFRLIFLDFLAFLPKKYYLLTTNLPSVCNVWVVKKTWCHGAFTRLECAFDKNMHKITKISNSPQCIILTLVVVEHWYRVNNERKVILNFGRLEMGIWTWN